MKYASAANTKAKDFSLALFNECILNRRIPNGTYGGVGGRGLITPSYPINNRILLLGKKIMQIVLTEYNYLAILVLLNDYFPYTLGIRWAIGQVGGKATDI
jgi:hypothetical protein